MSFAELRDLAVVVTGSSGGIGRAIALELARAGADVLAHARGSREAAEETANEVRRLGREANVLLCDLADEGEQDRLVEEAWRWRPIDVWVNNAGVDTLTGEAAHWTFEKKLEALWRVDVAATMRLSRLVGERMKRAGQGGAKKSPDASSHEQERGRAGGVILNIGWDQAWQGMAGDSGQLFAATKGAVMCFTQSLAQTLAPEVRVNCLAPGWIRTSWGRQASETWQRRAVEESLLSRWGTPEDVARAARFLCSPDAAFINGQTLPVNGGFRLGREHEQRKTKETADER